MFASGWLWYGVAASLRWSRGEKRDHGFGGAMAAACFGSETWRFTVCVLSGMVAKLSLGHGGLRCVCSQRLGGQV